MELNVTLARQYADVPDTEAAYGCKGEECDYVFQAWAHHPMWFCSGEANTFSGGSWIGHLLPGFLFVIWASHWMLGIMRSYFEKLRRDEPYVSSSWHRVLWLPRSWPMESVLKIMLPPLAICAELSWAHPTFRNMICEDDSPRAGHLVGNHINNWQHASMYPAFVVSGIADLMALKVDLPEGTPQVFLSLGFLVDAMLMGLHKKHTPIDMITHELLFYAMMASCITTALEAMFPKNFLISCGRIAATYLQGAWFFVIARVIFEGKTAWDTHGSDLAPVMYIPVLYAMFIGVILAGLVAMYLLLYAIYQPWRKDQDIEVHGMLSNNKGLPGLPIVFKIRNWSDKV